MGRTAGRWLMDSSLPDGHIFLPSSPGQITTGAGTLTRSGLGLLGTALAASQTATFDFRLENLLFRYGMQDDEQQQFGSALGVGQQALPVTGYTGGNLFATNLQQSGRPPYTQAQNQVVPTNRPKGIGITAITPVYSVSTLALTSVTLGLTKTVFVDTVAPVVTAMLAAGTNGLSSAVNAQPHATLVPLVSPNNEFVVSRLTELIAEITFVLPATSTAVFYGLFVDVKFNQN